MAAGRIVHPSYFPARNRDGELVAGALMAVRQNLSSSILASIYSDAGLTTPMANPVSANSSGQFPAVWCDAGAADEPVLYTLAFSGPDGESIGNPAVFDNWQPSLDADTAVLALAEAASSTAVGAAGEASASAAQADAALADVLAVAATGSDAAAIAARAAKSANLSDLTSASAARSNLGLGSIATQSAGAVAVTGGAISGLDDLAVGGGGVRFYGGISASEVQALLDEGAEQLMCADVVQIDQTITVPAGATLTIRGEAAANVNLVRLHGGARVYGLLDSTAFTGWNKAAVLIDGSSEQVAANAFREDRKTVIGARLLGGTSGTGNGTAVHLLADGNETAITGATRANPVVVTSPGHGRTNGTIVRIQGVVGMTEINGPYFTVANASTNTFQLQGVNGTAYGAYVSGGTVVDKSWIMNVEIGSDVDGFDDVVLTEQNATHTNFITSVAFANTRYSYPLRVLDMQTASPTGYDVDRFTGQITGQARASNDQTETLFTIRGQLHDITILPWDWTGGPGGTVKAIDIAPEVRSSNFDITISDPAFINNQAAAERTNTLRVQTPDEAGGMFVNDIRPPAGSLRVHTASVRLDNDYYLIGRTVAGTEQNLIGLNASDQLLIQSPLKADSTIVHDARASSGTGIHAWRVNGVNIGYAQTAYIESVTGGFRAGARLIADSSGDLRARSLTATEIGTASHAVNTTNKVAGKVVYDSTAGALRVASGATATSPWNLADGTSPITPA